MFVARVNVFFLAINICLSLCPFHLVVYFFLSLFVFMFVFRMVPFIYLLTCIAPSPFSSHNPCCIFPQFLFISLLIHPIPCRYQQGPLFHNSSFRVQPLSLLTPTSPFSFPIIPFTIKPSLPRPLTWLPSLIHLYPCPHFHQHHGWLCNLQCYC